MTIPDRLMPHACASFIFLCLCLQSLYAAASDTIEPYVHPDLEAKGQQADSPRLIKVGSRIYQAFAYDFSNIFYVEGDDGVIVIDSGWSQEASKQSLADFRKISKKPIVALIYTHGHGDHLGGARVMITENPKVPVKIYASDKWIEQHRHFNGALASHVQMRAAAQLGALLPDGKAGRVNIGAGKMRVNKVGIDFVAPTDTISKATEITIAGVRMEFIPMPSETIDQMLIWFPDDKVMHAADVAASAVPILSTPRNEPDREPLGFIQAIELMMSKPAEYLIAGHFPPIMGKDNTREGLLVQRDAAQFIYDQTIRALNMNLGPREAAEFVQLPSHLANHKLLVESYHRVPWLVRGLYSRYGGWYSGDSVDLNPLTKNEEAERIIKLGGGHKAVLKQAEQAFSNEDYQWSAQLSNYLLTAKQDTKEAKALKIKSLRAMAYASYSGNQRHYMLTDAMALEYGIGANKIRRAPKKLGPYKQLSLSTLLRLMGPNVEPQSCANKTLSASIRLKGHDAAHHITVRRGVFHHQLAQESAADVAISLERSVLERILAQHLSWKSALENNMISFEDESESEEKHQVLREFLSCFDLYRF